ncbi:SDR family NAD(P)-dependent oxidoreductase [Nocardioides sp.]|uniref:SDR family NAD(P)-dependent oxidoreductase n=1 Tax=Nocardioides sp. TaxID=35761 RepID=UPI0035150FDB
MDTWQPADIPDQSGRTVVVTGPTLGGLGHHTALELARRGARVVLAGRTPRTLDETAVAIAGEVPGADVLPLVVDLSDLASVRSAGEGAEAIGPIDVLVNNAGVMGVAEQRTFDGLELTMATNHFGPFLLTGLLMPQLVESGAGRVVTVSSHFHRMARRAPLEDPRAEGGRHRPWAAYARSKLANLLFTLELDRRCRRAEVPVKALAAHPGFAGTHLAANGQYGRSSGGVASILDATIRAVSQSAAAGAQPSLMAATAELPGGTYCGPGGLGEFAGRPQVTLMTSLARDEDAAARLWELSEQTTGIRYP